MGLAKLHVAHSKDEKGRESGSGDSYNSFILNNLTERVGFEFSRKRSCNNIERTAGTVKQWKAIVSSANRSQTDHGSVIAWKAPWRGGRNIDVPRFIPFGGRSQSVGLRGLRV